MILSRIFCVVCFDLGLCVWVMSFGRWVCVCGSVIFGLSFVL